MTAWVGEGCYMIALVPRDNRVPGQDANVTALQRPDEYARRSEARALTTSHVAEQLDAGRLV